MIYSKSVTSLKLTKRVYLRPLAVLLSGLMVFASCTETVLAHETIKQSVTSSMPSAALSGEVAPSRFTPEQQAEIGEIAANWLVQHPEYLVAASQSLQLQQQGAEQQMQQISALQNVSSLLADNSPSLGPKNAKIAVVMFFDYQSSACSKMNPIMLKLHQEYPDIRFIFREYPPLAARSPVSEYANRVGEAVWLNKGEEAYLGYHNALLSVDRSTQALTPDDVNHAVKSYLNNQQLAQAEEASPSSALQQRIEQNASLGKALQLTALPTFIVLPVNKASATTLTVMGGAVAEEALRQAILRAKA